MFLLNDQAHYQFMLRSSNMIERQRRRFSASYKKRNNHDRQKEKQQSKYIFQPFQSQEIKHKRYNHYKITDTSSKKSIKEERNGYRNASLLSNKFLSQSQTPKEKSNQFAYIMQGIKDALKLSDRRGKDTKKTQGRTKIQQFMCFKSKLHHQAYRSQLKEDSFLSKGVDPSLYEMKRFLRNQTAQVKKYVLNPTLVSNTVVCSSAVLYEQLPVSREGELNVESAQFKRSYINRRKSTPSQPAHRKSKTFQIVASEGDYNYYRKIKNYLEFMFKVNFSNKIYTNINLNNEEGLTHQRYKVFIGKGNNSLLVKSIIKRRFWWEVVNNSEDAQINLFWTQNKMDRIFALQKQSSSKKSIPLTKTKKIMRISQQQLNLNKKILNQQQISLVQSYINSQGFTQPYEQVFIPDILTNHLPKNNSIGSKKNLFKSLFNYYTNIALKNPFDFVPKTYHIISKDCEQFKEFLSQNAQDPTRIWIIKPGENTNRGKAIQLSPFSKIQQCLSRDKHQNGDPFTYIIQSYINKPFLYNNRKFDIRHYILLTSINGIFKGYWYKQGYIRTSSEPFQLQNLNNKYIHLTNDAIQKHSQNYEKYEPANKISYNQFQRYLDYNYHSKGYNFEKDILTKMKQMSIDIIKANYLILDSKRSKNNFEIFGLDFMIDKDFKPWLIQANYNPCLEVNCPVLERVIPGMLQNTFRIAVDPLFPPPSHFPSGKRFYLSDSYLKNLKYELIFDEQSLKTPIKNTYGYEQDELQNEQFQDEGCQIANIDL